MTCDSISKKYFQSYYGKMKDKNKKILKVDYMIIDTFFQRLETIIEHSMFPSCFTMLNKRHPHLHFWVHLRAYNEHENYELYSTFDKPNECDDSMF